jgi:hypothetical protein
MVHALHRLRTGDVVRIRAERWVIQQQSTLGDISMLDVRGVDPTNAGQRARFLLPFEPVESMRIPATPKVVRPAAWRRAATAALSTATSSPGSLRAAARARFDVMRFQLEPALAIVGGHGCRLLIADEVGLGKTVQAGLIIAELLERNPGGRALVVCPASLRSQWQEELRQRFDLDTTVLDSAGIARLAVAYDTSANPWSASPLVVTSIDFIKRPEVMRAVEGLVWDVVVFDEAHNLASRSDRATAAASLARRARTVVMLSATPHSGDEASFARLCSIGDVRGRFPLVLFRRTRRDAGLPVQRRTTWLEVRPTPAEMQMHSALIEYGQRVWQESDSGNGGRLALAVLLRRAASSAGSLARSLERRLASIAIGPVTTADQLALPFADHDGDEEPAGSIVAPGLRDAAVERRLLEQLLALARLAAARESKVAATLRWIARVREPVLIFTEYRDTLIRLRQALTTAGVPHDRIVELHGGLTRSERESAERRFSTGDADVLLATDAASEEVPWNPVRLEQRIGRVDRIGQRKRVHAIHLVAAGTFELTTVRRLIHRAQTAADALCDAAPSNEATANAILTGVEIPEGAAAASLPAAICRLDLSACSQEEVREVTTARQLLRRSPVPRSRAVAVVIGRHPRRLMCAFALTLTDSDGLPVWTTIVGLEGQLRSRSCLRTPDDVREALAAMRSSLDEPADCAAIRARDSAQQMMRAAITLGIEREEAIAAAVRLRHARVAADLLQPGLFDRRAERRAASQSLVLEEAIGGCLRRLESLARLSELHSDPPTLRFAVLLP